MLEWLENEETHAHKSLLMLIVIAPGDESDGLLTKDRQLCPGWRVPDLVTSLCENRSLAGKPKLLILQASRGSKYVK